MSRNRPGLLEQAVSGSRHLISHIKKKTAHLFLIASSLAMVGATGPCGITSSTTNNFPEDPPIVRNPEDLAVSAEVYQHSIGFHIDGDMTPEQASDGMFNYIRDRGISTLTDYFASGPLLSLARAAFDQIGIVGNIPSFDYYGKKQNDGSWSKDLIVNRGSGEKIAFMMVYNQGDQFLHEEGLTGGIINETNNPFKRSGDIIFLTRGEVVGKSPTVFVTRNPISLDGHLDPSYSKYFNQTLSVGNNGSPVIITFRPESHPPQEPIEDPYQPPPQPPQYNGQIEVEPNNTIRSANPLDFSMGDALMRGSVNNDCVRDFEADYFSIHVSRGDIFSVYVRRTDGNGGVVDIFQPGESLDPFYSISLTSYGSDPNLIRAEYAFPEIYADQTGDYIIRCSNYCEDSMKYEIRSAKR